ncbi:MAG: ABC transporter substrate-binding protein, partial [Caulobacterales bacterium]|nr:ABC transporter substrate-binding protein [Caulobacterales bacterium]
MTARLGFLALFAAAVATACSESARPRDTADEIRVVLNSDIRSTHVGVNRDGNTDTVMHHIVEGLVAIREDLTVAPDLARSVALSDDNRTYTFDLHRDVTFHNGAPMTSREVKWSLERIIDPARRHRCASLFNGATPLSASIAEIAAPDPYTVTVVLDEPTPLFLTLLANVQCTAGVLHPDSYGEAGAWSAPIGTGPYRLKQWRRGSYVLLERFDGYRLRGAFKDGYTGAKRALTQFVRFVIVADSGVAVEAVRRGEIDVLAIMPPALVSWSMEHASRVEHHGRPLLSWNVLLMHSDDPIVGDSKVRQAIAAAIDIDEVARFATYGRADGNFSAVSREIPGFTPVHDLKPVFDPERASALLEESGYKGEPIVIQTNRRFPTMYDNAV